MQILACARNDMLSLLARQSTLHVFCHPTGTYFSVQKVSRVLAHLPLLAAAKLEACESMVQHNRRVGSYMPGFDKMKNGQEQQLQKICRDTNKVAIEQIKGVSTQVSLPVPKTPALLSTSRASSLLSKFLQAVQIERPCAPLTRVFLACRLSRACCSTQVQEPASRLLP